MSCTELKLTTKTEKFHVNNVKLLEYLDEARRPWYSFCLSLGVEAVVVHIEADYKKEVFNGEQLTITTKLARLGNTSFTLEQTIRNADKELIVSAIIVLATINRETRIKTPLPDELRDQSLQI
jgi:YbgC/YbaW family acyl-CoA thioester hydrolase